MPHNASAPPIASSGVETSMPVTAAAVAKIGPNALTQTVRALREQLPDANVIAILQQCHQESLLFESPMEMVEERAFAALVAAVADQLGVQQAQQILWRAGTLTALYLLEHRIPRPLQWLLRPLPPSATLALFLLAIRQHAWTFVGSGQFILDSIAN